MGFILGFLLISFITTAGLLVPFINLLYKLKIQRQKQKTLDAFNRPTPIFDNHHRQKAGIPIGGGLLIIVCVTILFLFSFPILYYFWIPITSIYANRASEIKVLLFTFISFGLIGLYDDIKKVFLIQSENFFGLRLRHKLLLEILLAAIASFWLFAEMKIQI